MQLKSAGWVSIALINLCVVTLLGTLMRYKIGFEFPYFNQKYIQEAHSHFAFTGWITHTLFFLIVVVLHTNLGSIRTHLYQMLIAANVLTAYGMLISFFIQGYGAISIFFSTASILVSYAFSFFVLRDISRLPASHPGKRWLWGAIWLGIFSTIGTMVLSYMMASRQYDQSTYLGSIYFYLHFQYNGWFLFACIGLFLDRFQQLHFDLNRNRAFWMFFIASIPTFFLSILWADLPIWLYAIVVVASILQLYGWVTLIRMVYVKWPELKKLLPKSMDLILLVVASALTLKILLQLGSTIPEVSHLAFGFRPIVIAYLHLILLLIVTVFLLFYLFANQCVSHTKASRLFILLFTIGAILNEVVLAVQGVAAFSYTVIPYVNEALFGIALLMLVSAILLLAVHNRKSAIKEQLNTGDQYHLRR